jgi:hypothetical protein
MCKTSAQARAKLVEALELDLIGPSNGHPFERELLPRSPRTWYLTGVLVPVDAKVEAHEDPAHDEEIDAVSEDRPTDDGGTPDKAPKRRGYLPSSIGLSFLVPPEVESVSVRAEWGEYRYEVDGKVFEDEPSEDGPLGAHRKNAKDAKDSADEGATADQEEKSVKGYRRTPCESTMRVAIGAGTGAAKTDEAPLSGWDGLAIAKVVRVVDHTKVKSVPAGTRSVSLFLVNRRAPHGTHAYRAAIFQPRVVVECTNGFVPRPDPRGDLTNIDIDNDERIADLQFREVCEFAAGHGVATRAMTTAGVCSTVVTDWLPRATVERVEPTSLAGIEFGMEQLGALTDRAAVQAALGSLPAQYTAWIALQAATRGLNPAQAETLIDLVRSQKAVCKRLTDGIELLASKPDALEAFRIANRAMAAQARRRIAYTDNAGPEWRPFQLAFILMTLRGIDDPTHNDRETVDLLFFPTGGGKTEAYLGLAAFTLVLRRLRTPSIESAGVTVLMRYTLRLLTLDQLGRAAALICALELEREKDVARLGAHRFEIGLWVGSAATPNRMGRVEKGKSAPEGTALKRTLDFKGGRTKASPIPLESCPWCGTKFTKDSFRLEPNLTEPQDLFVYCADPKCDFTGDRRLPVLAVDEPIYRRLPCFLIATVDKFAALPWTAEVGNLLGHVNRHSPGAGFSRDASGGSITILPPELVIQDELHLISGPLGTIAGIYEGAIDALATRTVSGKRIRPKIVASTATVRRAKSQIKALFDRPEVMVFPPPGPNPRNSFFAETRSDEQIAGRQYVGIAAQGRSLKVVFLRALVALLSSGQTQYELNPIDEKNPADPYMTLVGYFNSLRELGGSRRIAEDEVAVKLKGRPRCRLEPVEAMFTRRKLHEVILELTSRVGTDEVATAKDRLGKPFSDKAMRVDLALATNMISVGLDITRLGLMVVLSQPKTSSEYIQATSRVGRHREKPGLVVVLLNIHKPRDRSHYERFENFHASFYRSVEATSVTPGSPRALDRALAPALVGLCRHAEDAFNPSTAAGKILTQRAKLDQYAEMLADRARSAAMHGEEQALHDHVLSRAKRLLDWWYDAAKDASGKGLAFSYDSAKGAGDRLLRDVLDPDLAALPIERKAFRAGRSMRDVEAPVDLYIQEIAG